MMVCDAHFGREELHCTSRSGGEIDEDTSAEVLVPDNIGCADARSLKRFSDK
jgi:hypothetical protein